MCSLRLYQLLVMIMKDGATAPSVKPRRNRVAPKLANPWEAPRHISTEPHNILNKADKSQSCAQSWIGLCYSHSNADKGRDRQSAHQVGSRVLGAKLAKVEERDCPRELLTTQVQIFGKTKDGSIIDTLLVKILRTKLAVNIRLDGTVITLEEVNNSHDGHDDPIELLNNRFFLGRIDVQFCWHTRKNLANDFILDHGRFLDCFSLHLRRMLKKEKYFGIDGLEVSGLSVMGFHFPWEASDLYVALILDTVGSHATHQSKVTKDERLGRHVQFTPRIPRDSERPRPRRNSICGS